MEGIQRVVTDMVRACRDKNVEVSETLAAFMARAVILDRPERFTPDKPLNPEDVTALIDICVDRLSQTDSPDLETVCSELGEAWCVTLCAGASPSGLRHCVLYRM